MNNTESTNGGSILWVLIAALTWGITNPLLKKTSLESEPSSSLLDHLYFLITHWQFCVTQLCNWCGTLFLLKALSQTDLTLAVPVTNALTFVVTELCDTLLFASVSERTFIEHLRVYGGMALVCLGTALCITSNGSCA